MFSFNNLDYLMHDLPPLNSLRAFAISHQIRGLEALLGVQLFERRG